MPRLMSGVLCLLLVVACETPNPSQLHSSAPILRSVTLPGERIVFHSDRDGDLEIYSMNPDGSDQRRLTTSPGSDAFPALSPDFKRIAFQSERDASLPEIYVMDASGANVVRLTANADFDGDPAWSPDGSHIAFTSGRDGNGEIYVMRADGTAQVNITNTPDLHESEPAWSPQGTMIVFVSTGSDFVFTIHIANADGSGRREVTEGLDPAWSPDGRRIAFFRGADIWTMNADGSDQTRVTYTATNDRLPAWSPDGTRIVFESPRLGPGFENLFAINPDGSGETQLTFGPPGLNRAPNWGTPSALAPPPPPPPPAPVEVAIDANPANKNNNVSCRNRNAVLRVAVLSSAAFDATTIDPQTARLGPAGAAAIAYEAMDANRDRRPDAVLTFRLAETGLTCADRTVVLTATSRAGVSLIGRDALRMVGAGPGG